MSLYNETRSKEVCTGPQLQMEKLLMSQYPHRDVVIHRCFKTSLVPATASGGLSTGVFLVVCKVVV
jgi:hypothetical protein